MNHPKSQLDDLSDLRNRYSIQKSTISTENSEKEIVFDENKPLKDFIINAYNELEEMKYKEKAIRYEDVAEDIAQEQKLTKEAQQK